MSLQGDRHLAQRDHGRKGLLPEAGKVSGREASWGPAAGPSPGHTGLQVVGLMRAKPRPRQGLGLSLGFLAVWSWVSPLLLLNLSLLLSNGAVMASAQARGVGSAGREGGTRGIAI